MQRFKKIKFEPGKLLLSWHVGNLNGTLREIVLTSSEQPAPEFVKALRAFQKPIEALLGIAVPADGNGISDEFYFDAVRGLVLLEEKESPTESRPRGVMVTLAKSIEGLDVPFVATTPRIDIDKSLERLVATMERHAERFCEGARAQGSLFPEGVTVTVTSEDPASEQVERGASDEEWNAAVARGKALTDPAAEDLANAPVSAASASAL